MRRQPTIHKQVELLFEDAFALGTKRHAAKAQLRAQGRKASEMGEKIHSAGSFHTYRSRCLTFIRWTRKNHQLHHLAQLTPAMVVDYFASLTQQGYAQNTLATLLTALRWLDKLSLAAGMRTDRLVPEDLHSARRFSPRGAYTPEEADALINEVRNHDPLAAQVLHIQYRFGLRLNEVVNLKWQFFRHAGSQEQIAGIDLKLRCVFVKGKGGRQRRVTATRPDGLSGLRMDVVCPLIPEACTVKTWKREIQALVRAACITLNITPRGTHGLRATAAREFHALQCAGGKSAAEADQATAQWLGHGRTTVLRHYFRERNP